MYDLTPLIETWLENEGFVVSVLANRIEGTKQAGVFKSHRVTIFLEDYIGLCSIRMQGNPDTCQRLTHHLQSLSVKENQSSVCQYCGALVDANDKKCPNCGAPIKK